MPNCLYLESVWGSCQSACVMGASPHTSNICVIFLFFCSTLLQLVMHSQKHSRCWALIAAVLCCCPEIFPHCWPGWLSKPSATLWHFALLQRVALSTFCINQCNSPKMALCVAPTTICSCHWKAFLLKDWAVMAETWLCSRHREELDLYFSYTSSLVYGKPISKTRTCLE